ncbi:MAG: hypothetical protein PVG51_10020 [Desulfosarcina sp.]|jgi:hypothetical protein
MSDDRPFIIVDDQKIRPISRVTKTDIATHDRAAHHDDLFDVVDRVTLSAVAKAKSKQLQSAFEAETRDVFLPARSKPPSALPKKTH